MADKDPRVKAAIDRGFDPNAAYVADLKEVQEPMKSILEKYSKIPQDQQVAHVKELRDRAFAIYPYICIASFGFLTTKIHKLPCYTEIVERVKGGQKFLDLGCGFGQELRQLIYDGAPAENLYGSDLHTHFIDLGFELFKDRETLKTEFIASDILDGQSALVSKLTGQLDILYASLIFHHFTWEQQIDIAKRMVNFLCDKPDSMIVGRLVAYRNVKETEQIAAIQSIQRLQPFHHDLDSWKKMWGIVQEECRVKFTLDTWELEDEWFEQRPVWKDVSYFLCFSFRREE
ncbi:hypothetical protein AA313_de0205848 [Arthrobotrys entomopaga]|nr:hypothetical protein AA313_de0205848 [Arthrobotrys entomopaga]